MDMNNDQQEYCLAYGNEEVLYLDNSPWTYCTNLQGSTFKLYNCLEKHSVSHVKDLVWPTGCCIFPKASIFLMLPRHQTTIPYYRLQYLASAKGITPGSPSRHPVIEPIAPVAQGLALLAVAWSVISKNRDALKCGNQYKLRKLCLHWATPFTAIVCSGYACCWWFLITHRVVGANAEPPASNIIEPKSDHQIQTAGCEYTNTK